MATILVVGERFIHLIFTPYKTMRKISQEKNYVQLIIIGCLVFGYFYWATKIKDFILPSYLMLMAVIFNLAITIVFFYFFFRLIKVSLNLKSLVFTYIYSLFPTLIWFFTNSLFYFFLPPPRTTSFLGNSFSIFFIAFSISLLAWKIILVYLALRFSAKQSFYRLIFALFIFGCFFLPYSLLLYQLKIFRIPFI